MFETPIQIIGNIVNDPIRRRVGEQELTKFRMASNARRRTDEGGWAVTTTLYVTVNCWGSLASGVGASLIKGDPVVVVGTAYTSEYVDRDENKRSAIEVKALSVGPDLMRCTARVSAPRRPGLADAAAPDVDGVVAGDVTDDPAPDDGTDEGADEQGYGAAADGIDHQGLPLTA
jgi:single-strand DNA-binding protein